MNTIRPLGILPDVVRTWFGIRPDSSGGRPVGIQWSRPDPTRPVFQWLLFVSGFSPAEQRNPPQVRNARAFLGGGTFLRRINRDKPSRRP